jgi:Flp pilus assembly pilin Flp
MNKKISPRVYSYRNKGILSLEYALLISAVVAALLGMSVYLGRAASGRWRDVGDGLGFGRQYEPGVTSDSSVSGVVSGNSVGQPNCHVEVKCEGGGREGPRRCGAVQVCN